MTWDGKERRSKQRDIEDMQKRVMKEAIKEWLDEQFARFGRWSFYGIAAAGLGALAYFLLTASGWHK